MSEETKTERRVWIVVEKVDYQKVDGTWKQQKSKRELDLTENVEAPYALAALGIVLRRCTQIPMALRAAAEGDDPFRTGSGA
jgi:hypothetical protein